MKWKQVLLWWSEDFRLSQHQKYYLSIIVSAYKVLIAFTHFCAVSCNIQFASILTGAGILQFIWTKLWAICEPSPCLFLLCNCCSLVRTLFLLWCHSPLVFILLLPWKWRQLILLFTDFTLWTFVLLKFINNFEILLKAWSLDFGLLAKYTSSGTRTFLLRLYCKLLMVYSVLCFCVLGMLVILLFQMTIRSRAKVLYSVSKWKKAGMCLNRESTCAR